MGKQSDTPLVPEAFDISQLEGHLQNCRILNFAPQLAISSRQLSKHAGSARGTLLLSHQYFESQYLWFDPCHFTALHRQACLEDYRALVLQTVFIWQYQPYFVCPEGRCRPTQLSDYPGHRRHEFGTEEICHAKQHPKTGPECFFALILGMMLTDKLSDDVVMTALLHQCMLTWLPGDDSTITWMPLPE
eukprot:TRINITY_DN12623_c0_g2_i5.p2 TRINITY_DN12623_c0_g2~~TRINITY_DN12623_c0_g2_i5.p2  ORF type:complete len:189 (+),score=15.80 TRINITY_DN12623_c0_g2_i5:768-1334(+)